jgi:hypothetical protein
VAREIIFFGGNVIEFYKSQDSKVQLKIEYVLDLVRFERQVPIKFFKKLESTNGIYEVRIIHHKKAFEFFVSRMKEYWWF